MIDEALMDALYPAEKWIIVHESNYDTSAQNPNSTAFGLGQLIVANRISIGTKLGIDPDTTDAASQIMMMRVYIIQRYGTCEAAMAFHQKHGWY